MESVAQISFDMFRANIFDLTHAHVYNTHILLSTAAIQQIRCREHLVPEH